jgi:hypothetical protein
VEAAPAKCRGMTCSICYPELPSTCMYVPPKLQTSRTDVTLMYTITYLDFVVEDLVLLTKEHSRGTLLNQLITGRRCPLFAIPASACGAGRGCGTFLLAHISQSAACINLGLGRAGVISDRCVRRARREWSARCCTVPAHDRKRIRKYILTRHGPRPSGYPGLRRVQLVRPGPACAGCWIQGSTTHQKHEESRGSLRGLDWARSGP